MSAASAAGAAPMAPDAARRAGIVERIEARARRWWEARSTRTDTLELTQKNVYILPTRAGFMFAFTLAILLVASINYQLNLGYVLTFLLASSGVVSMYVTHSTLSGLALHLKPVTPVFAGDSAVLEAVLTSAGAVRHGIGIRIESAPPDTLAWVDVPTGGQVTARVSFVPGRRGLHALPTIGIETRFPLGLFRAWSLWRPASQVLVYPALEKPAAALPAATFTPGGSARSRADGSEVEGVRAYRRGDALKSVAWKKTAKSLEAGGDLISRDTVTPTNLELWLDLQNCGPGLHPGDIEGRLSRLASWVVVATGSDVSYGLRLPRLETPMLRGEMHRRACMEALALWV